jgi:hypothetical protein
LFAEISQLWSPDTNVTIYIHGEEQSNSSHDAVCDLQEDLNYEESFTKEYVCFEGYTGVGLYVYLDEEFSVELCEGCVRPDQDTENVIVYYFEVS